MKNYKNLLVIPVMPILLLGLFRAIWFLAGAEWSHPSLAAVFALLIGSLAGFIAFAFLEGIWPSS